jgi:uncharacterized membrane protein affecting hemolysin expression|tara:strand:- start:256 stop:396 length:141 start_codon:yes stop_codon:yes gene_type:complete
MKIIILIILILSISYILLYLYFDYRMEKRYKAYKKRVKDFKIKKDE